MGVLHVNFHYSGQFLVKCNFGVKFKLTGLSSLRLETGLCSIVLLWLALTSVMGEKHQENTEPKCEVLLIAETCRVGITLCNMGITHAT